MLTNNENQIFTRVMQPKQKFTDGYQNLHTKNWKDNFTVCEFII